MGHSFGDGLIVASLAAALVAYFYFRHAGRQRRLDILHQERLAAMDKGIPLPELPLDPASAPKREDPRELLLHGIVWTALGGGAMMAFLLLGWRVNDHPLWPLPLPLALLGLGLILYYVLGDDRAR